MGIPKTLNHLDRYVFVDQAISQQQYLKGFVMKLCKILCKLEPKLKCYLIMEAKNMSFQTAYCFHDEKLKTRMHYEAIQKFHHLSLIFEPSNARKKVVDISSKSRRCSSIICAQIKHSFP